MSTEHGNALPDIRPAVMAAMCKHAQACAGFSFFAENQRPYEADDYHQQYLQALNELAASGVMDENGYFDLTPAEYDGLIAFYADELERLQSTHSQASAA